MRGGGAKERSRTFDDTLRQEPGPVDGAGPARTGRDRAWPGVASRGGAWPVMAERRQARTRRQASRRTVAVHSDVCAAPGLRGDVRRGAPRSPGGSQDKGRRALNRHVSRGGATRSLKATRGWWSEEARKLVRRTSRTGLEADPLRTTCSFG